MPAGAPQLDLLMYYWDHHLRVALDHEMVPVSAPTSELAPVSVGCDGQRVRLSADETVA